MKHPSDIEMIEHTAGQLPPDRRTMLDAHFADCAECRSRRGALGETWTLMGEWQETGSSHDLSRGVVAAAAAERAAKRPASLWQRGAPALRLAAMLLLSVGLGHIAGRLVPARASRPPAVGPAAAQAEERAGADSLFLDVFELTSPAGMAGVLLGDEPPDEEEGV
ncbi:hypothetical protein HQ560_08835 [bacterium]|nr:hypothetical protein [bacterium]